MARATPWPRAAGRTYMRLTSREAVEQSDAAAANGCAVERGDEEAHVRLEDGLEWQPVAVLGRVFSGQDVFQFRDQQTDRVVGGGGQGNRSGWGRACGMWLS